MRVSVYIDNSNVFKNLKKVKDSDHTWIQLYNPLELAKAIVGNRQLEKVYFYCVPPPAWLLSKDQKVRKNMLQR